MSGEQYVILGYGISILVLWGYALSLYAEHRRLRNDERMKKSTTPNRGNSHGVPERT